jgi:hypothetical protein
MARTMTLEQREKLAADAAQRYTAGESWQEQALDSLLAQPRRELLLARKSGARRLFVS